MKQNMFKINWKVALQAEPYVCGTAKCNLPLTEKLIMDMFKNMRQDFANNWTLVIVLGFDLYISFSLFEYVLIDGVVK